MLANIAQILAETKGEGDAGSIEVRADTLTVEGGTISSSTFAAGNAGDVTIIANNARVSQSAVPNPAQGLPDTGVIISSAIAGATGNAGDVSVQITDTLIVENGGAISASSTGDGAMPGLSMSSPTGSK